jgi:hypothetical protein
MQKHLLLHDQKHSLGYRREVFSLGLQGSVQKKYKSLFSTQYCLFADNILEF